MSQQMIIPVTGELRLTIDFSGGPLPLAFAQGRIPDEQIRMAPAGRLLAKAKKMPKNKRTVVTEEMKAQAVAMFDEGKSVKQIVRTVGCSDSSVRYTLKNSGRRFAKQFAFSNENIAFLRENFPKDPEATAGALGRSLESCRKKYASLTK